MAIKILRLATGNEVWGKDGKCKSVESPYYITGASDKKTAVQGVIALAEQSLNGIPLKEFRVSEFDKDKNLEVTAVYERSSSSGSSSGTEEDYSTRISYSAGESLRTVTTGELILSRAPSGKTPPNVGNFVNWNGKRGRDFSVAGVNIPTANPRLGITKYVSASEANSASFQTKLEALVGCVNASSWRGREAGTVMFVNFSFAGVASGSEKIAVTYEFLIRPNEKNAQVGGVSVGNVAGWDYVWAITEPTPDGPPEVKGAYVSRVCRFVNFSQIGV